VPAGASIISQGLSNHTSVVIGNYVYLFGGVNGTAGTKVVLQAPLQ
jgi:hypothetical protein